MEELTTNDSRLEASSINQRASDRIESSPASKQHFKSKLEKWILITLFSESFLALGIVGPMVGILAKPKSFIICGAVMVFLAMLMSALRSIRKDYLLIKWTSAH